MSKKNTNHQPTIVYRNKPRYKYVPVQEALTSDTLGTYVTYSISVRTVEEEIAFVRDVSPDFEDARDFAEKCTENQLNPEHLDDLIEDFLVEPTLTI